MTVLYLDGPLKGEVMIDYFVGESRVGIWNDLLEAYVCTSIESENDDEGS